MSRYEGVHIRLSKADTFRGGRMPYVRTTLCMDPATARRLRDFARRSGLTQSAIVSGIIRCGLDKLEANWRSADDVLAAALNGAGAKPVGGTVAGMAAEAATKTGFAGDSETTGGRRKARSRVAARGKPVARAGFAARPERSTRRLVAGKGN